MSALFPLIKRKLRAPSVPDTFVSRPGLLERLGAGMAPRTRLTFVCAGPGYGKSTTVADYVRQSGARSCWINLDAYDADLSTFLHYLIGGATAAWPGATSQARELLAASADPTPLVPSLMGLFAEELGERDEAPFILVLDDFHLVHGTEGVVQAIEALIGYLPENVQLILISRAQPPLRLPQLKVRQQLVELGIPDLRFSPREVETLVRSVSGRAIAEADARTLFESTEGWAAGLIMAAQQSDLLTRPHEGTPSLFDYLAQEVFAELAPDRQDFLLKTALLPVVEPGICASALGLVGAEETIQALRRANLILTRAESAESYYHPIFHAFLQEKLKETLSAETLSALRRRIGAEWADAHPEEALAVLLDGELYPEAERILVRIAPGYLAQVRLAILDQLLQRFPAEFIDASPWLLLHSGEIQRLWGRSDLALSRFERAAALAESQGDRLVQGRALAYQAAIWGGRGDGRLSEFAEQALDLLPEDDWAGRAFAWNALGMAAQMASDARAALSAFERAQDFYRRAEDFVGQSKVLHNLGLTYARQGDFARSVATYRESIRQAEAGGRRAFPATYNNLATVYHSQGAYDEAWRVAEEGLALAQQLGARRDALWTTLTLGMVACSLGQEAKATDFFQQTREGALSMGDRPLEAQALSGLAEVARLQRQYDRAQELLNQAIALRGTPIEAPGMIDLQIPAGQLALDRGEWDRAADILAIARETLSNQGFRYRLAQVLFLLAKGQRAQGDARALETWEEARALCEANAYSVLLAQSPRPELASEPAPVLEVARELPPSLPPDLCLRCFGAFEAIAQGGAIATKQWQGTKTKLVLAYLLHQRQGVTREQLAQLLYGDEDVSRGAILMIISRLRQALEPDLAKNAPSRYIQWREGKYFFNFGAPYALDVQEFAYHLDQAKDVALSAAQQTQALEKALELYRGRFLADLDESLWVQSTQEHFHQRALAAFQRLLTVHEDAAAFETVLVWADRALAVDPCAEFAHRAKMTALHRLGNRQGAVRHYQQMEAILSQELGVAPDPESKAVYAQILAGSA
ncbi:tetratricopeptide repeat protein [bacterium]|nr:tetratricopeptide repeat protein [bacterium]